MSQKARKQFIGNIGALFQEGGAKVNVSHKIEGDGLTISMHIPDTATMTDSEKQAMKDSVGLLMENEI